MQYQDTGWFSVLFVVALVFFILFNIWRARGSKDLFIRRIAGLNAIDEAIGRATEMGKPVLMVPGIGDLDQIGVQAQALMIFSHITKTAARFGTPIRLCVANAATYTMAQEIIRDVYQSEGLADSYDPDTVQFVSDRQFAFAAGVSGMIHRDRMAACFLMGAFYAESLIFAETANSIGSIQVASSTQNTQTPFFIAACDYVLIGDEFYAASAYLSREPVLVGSLVGQDWCKILVASTIVFGVLANTVQRRDVISETRTADGRWIPAEAHRRTAGETFVSRYFTPAVSPKGQPAELTFASLDAYVTARTQELSAEQPTPGAQAEIAEQKGQWYRYEVPEGDTFRPVEDFVVVQEDGSVRVLRIWRGRLQREPEETPTAATEEVTS
jgi:hypothetical protein